MKKYGVMMAVMLLLFSSCGRKADHVSDLGRETEAVPTRSREEISVIINKNSMTFHLDAACSYLSQLKEENRMELSVEASEDLLSYGYKPCGRCAEDDGSKNDMLP